ncbi:MAG: YybH family protein [Phycisphaeraceae bacterium]
MKRLLLAALPMLCLAALGCHSAPRCGTAPDADAITTEVHAMMHQSARDWTANDLDAFMRSFHDSDDLVFATPSGITTGWDNVKARYTNSIDQSDLTFSDIQVTALTPDAALVFARFHNTMNDGAYATGLTTLLMRKIDGRWVIVHDHSSGLPRDTPR